MSARKLDPRGLKPGSGIWSAAIDGTFECTQDVFLFCDGFESGDLAYWSDS